MDVFQNAGDHRVLARYFRDGVHRLDPAWWLGWDFRALFVIIIDLGDFFTQATMQGWIFRQVSAHCRIHSVKLAFDNAFHRFPSLCQ